MDSCAMEIREFSTITSFSFSFSTPPLPSFISIKFKLYNLSSPYFAHMKRIERDIPECTAGPFDDGVEPHHLRTLS